MEAYEGRDFNDLVSEDTIMEEIDPVAAIDDALSIDGQHHNDPPLNEDAWVDSRGTSD